MAAEFSDRVSYSRYDEITVEVSLSGNSSTPVSVEATVDTGSKFCIFQPRYAPLLGFVLETGTKVRIRTAAGSFVAYGHEVTLTISSLEWSAVVYFAEVETFPVNVVGRVGFLDHLQVGLVDYDQMLYIGPHDAA
jgi:hypothetical protein